MRRWLVATLLVATLPVATACSGADTGPVFVDDEVRPTTSRPLVVPLTTVTP